MSHVDPGAYRRASARILRSTPDVRDSVGAATRAFDAHRVRALSEVEADRWRDWATAAKSHALTHLDRYLEQAAVRLSANGTHVHWAETAEDALAVLDGIVDRHGVRTAVKGKSMLSEELAVNEHLESLGIEGMDQTAYNRFASSDDVKAFTKDVKKRTDGEGAHIVCDMLRGPVFDAGLQCQSRMGVNVSAGWQLDTKCTYNSANLSVRQITVDHMHYETVPGSNAATELYGRVFRPTVHDEIYAFEDLPRAFEEMHQNTQTGIPIVQIANDLPASVKGLIP